MLFFAVLLFDKLGIIQINMSAIIFALSFHYVRSSLMKKEKHGLEVPPSGWRSNFLVDCCYHGGVAFHFPYHPCMVYLPTFGWYKSTKRRWIYHTWILWDWIWIFPWYHFIFTIFFPWTKDWFCRDTARPLNRSLTASPLKKVTGLPQIKDCAWFFFRGYGGATPRKLTYRLNAGTRRLCSFLSHG